MGVVGETDPFEPGCGASTGLGLGDVAGAQPEGDVLQRRQVGEQQVVLEHDGNGTSLRDDERAGRRVVERFTVEFDGSVVDRQQPGEAAEQRRLAGAVGAEYGDGFAALGGQIDVEAKRTEGADDAGIERHGVGGRPPPRNRSRRATSTPKDTAINTRLNTIASSGSISLVR